MEGGGGFLWRCTQAESIERMGLTHEARGRERRGERRGEGRAVKMRVIEESGEAR